jgi:tRNA nucleotidyltransferase (CCA-adding enzyme)
MKTYLVGGAVRDELLGLPVTERDYVVVGATEQEMLERGFRRLDVAFPVFLHPDSGDEYALARRERKSGPGYKGFEVDAGPHITLEQDLARRDLSVNALALDQDGNLIDLFHGRDDLDAGLLRHITPAFDEDPVRVLRAARFAAKLGRWGFRIAHGTFALMQKMARRDELLSVLPDRLREEMLKALGSEQPWRFFETLHRCGALQRLLPAVADAIGTPAGGHAGERMAEPMAALKRAAAAAPEPADRFAALLAAAVPGPKAGAEICNGLRMDRDSTDLLGWALEWPADTVLTADAEQLLQLLERLKALHHPQRLQRLGGVWNAVAGERGAAALEPAQRAMAAAASVDATALAGEGWRGPGLGRRLRQHRLEAIAAELRRMES